MKRQDSHLSTSSRRDNSPDSLSTKSIGCMSGIFQLLSKYQNRRKLLTSGKKHTKKSCLPQTKPAKIEKVEKTISCNVGPVENIRMRSVTPENSVEKRKQILGALEKCDKDLKALKRIIEVLGSAETKSESQPSPVSVLDEFTGSPLIRGKERKEDMKGQIIQQSKKPREEHIFSKCFTEQRKSEWVETSTQEIESWTMTTNKAMIESVNEVCRNITWGQRREIGRIGLALQDFIFKDLIEEIVKELRFPTRTYYSLPFDACRRKLCF